MENLSDLVERMERRYPRVIFHDGAGSRAALAADYVRCGAVHYMGDQGGADYWRVDSHVCSIRNGHCDCMDTSAPADANGGKLCKHRIAAQFQKLMGRGIEGLLRSVDADQITLLVDVLYGDNGRIYTLGGYRIAGWVKLEYDERIKFTEAEFNAALRVAGWGMDRRPARQRGIAYHYFLKRGAPSDFSLNDLTAQDVDKMQERETMKQLFTVDEMAREAEGAIVG